MPKKRKSNVSTFAYSDPISFSAQSAKEELFSMLECMFQLPCCFWLLDPLLLSMPYTGLASQPSAIVFVRLIAQWQFILDDAAAAACKPAIHVISWIPSMSLPFLMHRIPRWIHGLVYASWLRSTRSKSKENDFTKRLVALLYHRCWFHILTLGERQTSQARP